MTRYISVIKNKIHQFAAAPPKGKVETYIVKYLNTSRQLTVVDIGAHRGDFIHEVEKFYTVGKAILIEPIAALADYLRVTFKKERFQIYNNVIADKEGENVPFQINEFAETSSLLPFKEGMKELDNVNTRPAKMEMVASRTLDAIAGEIELKEIDLLKIDVQGVEHLVLRGAKKTLPVTHYVWVELSFRPLYSGSAVFHDIYTIMEESGFILLELSPGHRSPLGEMLQADALFVNTKYLPLV